MLFLLLLMLCQLLRLQLQLPPFLIYQRDLNHEGTLLDGELALGGILLPPLLLSGLTGKPTWVWNLFLGPFICLQKA